MRWAYLRYEERQLHTRSCSDNAACVKTSAWGPGAAEGLQPAPAPALSPSVGRGRAWRRDPPFLLDSQLRPPPTTHL